MRRPTREISLFAVLGIIYSGGAWSSGFQANPSIACDFMTEEGLRTRGGYQGSGDIYRCRSQRRNLVSGGSVNNSIRFIAQGNAETVTQLRLDLQVNSRTGVQRAHRQLIDHARSLMKNALNRGMPDEIEAAILGANMGTWNVGASSVTLKRIVGGVSGYELRFRIQ